MDYRVYHALRAAPGTGTTAVVLLNLVTFTKPPHNKQGTPSVLPSNETSGQTPLIQRTYHAPHDTCYVKLVLRVK